ncbi:MAG: flap endonuclease [Planctomycetes bacterium]|nr:flap endonuclease [Planctomycetota bacterium]
MFVHLIDGTYELFRNYFAVPSALAPDGREVGATRGVLASLAAMLREPEVTHVAVAFDTVIESFRNELFAGYKTGEGMDPVLHQQFELVERAVRALGIPVWSMVEFEADDALASGAVRYGADPRVERVLLCTPDKDLAQMVCGERIVGFDRRKRAVLDEPGVHTKFGVGPASIPDLLALIGDEQDGIPGLPKWGAKSAALVLAHYQHLEAIPDDAAAWTVVVRGAAGLAASLREARGDAMLYRRLATLRTDVPLAEDLDALRWRGAAAELPALCAEIGFERLLERLPAPRPA